MNKIAESEEVFQQLEQKREERKKLWETRLWGETVHLTDKNVERVRQNATEKKEQIEKILKTFSQSTIPAEKMSGIDFLTLKHNTFKTELIEGILNPSSINIPDKKFQFGFDSYQTSQPEDADTVILQKQLKIVRELMQICAKAQVEKINKIRRVEFETAPDTASTQSPSKEPLISLGNEFVYLENPGPGYLYSVMPFELEVVCLPDALRAFLNELARSKYIILPKVFKIENQQKDKL